MASSWLSRVVDRIPGLRRMSRIPGQLLAINPFDGEQLPSRVRLFHPGSGRPSLPFPHPWNYRQPIRIMDTFFWKVDHLEGVAKHNRYLGVPGFEPVLITRDPGLIRSIATNTGDKAGQFDRDTLPTTGIARATGEDTLLYSNGAVWRHQRKLSASPFGKTTLFQPEKFEEFAETFRGTVRRRLQILQDLLQSTGQESAEVEMEAEIKVVMMEMLTNNFFGAEIEETEIRDRYVPAIERVIERIVKDTVVNRIGVPVWRMPSLTSGIASAREDAAAFDRLTDLMIAARHAEKGHWKKFKSDAPDKALRSNLKVFLAGALEATTSFASWAIAHLARNVAAQEKVFQEVKDIEIYSPENLMQAGYLLQVLDETLRLTPSLYFLPRRATADSWLDTSGGTSLMIPKGTHVLLDVWHANRSEDHWGTEVTGYPADQFAPERWESSQMQSRKSKEMLHFGFGHGPRVCPGKHLGQLEVALVVGAIVKMFSFDALQSENPAKAGVSTKPVDGARVNLRLRD